VRIFRRPSQQLGDGLAEHYFPTKVRLSLHYLGFINFYLSVDYLVTFLRVEEEHLVIVAQVKSCYDVFVIARVFTFKHFADIERPVASVGAAFALTLELPETNDASGLLV